LNIKLIIKKQKMDGIGIDTLVGLALGAATVIWLWNRTGSQIDALKNAPSNNNTNNQAKKYVRDFTLESLMPCNGREGRAAYVALREPEDGVYDVTSSAKEYLECAGGELDEKFDADLVKARFPKVGRLIRPREYTSDEVYEMNGKNGKPVWLSAKGEVFDVTRGADFYGPEGGYSLFAGRDASRALALVSLEQKDVENNRIDDLSAGDIMTLEEWRAQFHRKYTCIGTLKGWSPAGSPLPNAITGKQPTTTTTTSTTTTSSTTTSDPTFLTKERQRVILKEKIALSPDTFLFRFGLPQPNMRLGLPIGKHIKFWCPNPKPKVAGEWNGRPDPEAGKPEIERKYTPSSLDSEAQGHFDVIVKVYRPNEKFCDGGKMSQHLGDLKVGDSMDVAGPFGLIEYKGNGEFQIQKRTVLAKNVGLMAGGTGVTPMLQLLKSSLSDPKDTTKLSLIFANQTEADILVRDLLEDLQQKHPDRFKLHYTLDRPPASGWKYSTGFINQDMIKSNLPPPGAGTFIFMCGPPPMVKFACKENLVKLGYDEKEGMAEF
jgi:cytochrome-b5 reductase